MTDFINFLNAYTLWVRLAVVSMFMAIVILLVFFKASSKEVNVEDRVSHSASHGLEEFEEKVLIFLATPDLPGQVTPGYVAHMIATHEINVRKAAKELEEKKLIIFAHVENTDGDTVVSEEWWLILLEKGREFLGEHKLLN